ncbi:MAG: hypothetical protein IPM66_25030 [Acidobacteriota bacterium]|nr:MAG: hypothetical protein IPM66_08345 [Acidobacteriota bacterium]QQS49649.1 MAG: hypothetical protein IPM66_25030 [Acidobacteriota bacterium]
MLKPISKSDYVVQVLHLYLTLAETPTRYSRLDWRLAEDLYDQQIGLKEVEAAMILASARRLFRSSEAPKLGPIRSLHYFVPVIEEVLQSPLSPDYIAYLRRKLAAIQPVF